MSPMLTVFEVEMRRRIWVTVQLLDLTTAMRTGTSYLYREYDADPPLDMNDNVFHRSEHGWVIDTRWVSPGGLTDSTFQLKLAGLLPLLLEVTNHVNSPTQPLADYDRVRTWDSQLRHKLQEAEAALTVNVYGPSEGMGNAGTHVQFLRVLVHRNLLGLHHEYASGSRAGQYPDSTMAIMQSALALLRIRQIWQIASAAVPVGAPSRSSSASPAPSTLFEPLNQSSQPLGWLVDLCHDDFGVAMLQLVLALRRYDFEATQQNGLPSRSGAFNILRWSLELMRARACRSMPLFKEFIKVSVSIGCLRSLEAGEPMLATLLEVADQIEQTVIQGRWPQTTGHAFPGQAAGLPPDPFSFGYGQ